MRKVYAIGHINIWASLFRIYLTLHVFKIRVLDNLIHGLSLLHHFTDHERWINKIYQCEIGIKTRYQGAGKISRGGKATVEIPQLKGYESYRFVEGLLAFYFCLRIWNPLLFQEGALVHNFYNSCLITAVNKPVAYNIPSRIIPEFQRKTRKF